jgi:hypothetical protein
MKGKSNLLTLALLGIFINALNPILQARAEIPKDAYFMHMNYAPKIHANKDDIWRFTIYNAKCMTNESGEAWFFFVFYIDGTPWWDEYNNTRYKIWRCDKGNMIINSYRIDEWNVMEPHTREVKVELYWYFNGEPYLKDAVFFSFDITVLLPLYNIYAFSYLVVYLIVCFILLFNFYITALEFEE